MSRVFRKTPSRALILTIASISWLACSKDSVKKPRPVAPPDDLALAASATTDIWSQAPANTVVGVVVAPGTGDFLLAAAREFEQTMSQHPLGQELLDKMRADMDGKVPKNALDPAYIKSIGLDLSRPAAIFMTRDEQPLAVLPVSDRQAFRTLVEGTVDGDVDVLDDDMRCKQSGAYYLCAKTDEMLAGAGQGKDLQQKLAGRDASMRGHVELYVDGEFMQDKEAVEVLGPIAGLYGALELERGGFNARAHLASKPAHPGLIAAASVPSRLAERVAAENPAGFWRVRIPFGALLPPGAAAEMAPVAKVTGLDPKADILDNLTGEAILYSVPHKGIGTVLEIGAKDGKRFGALFDALCAKAKESLPPQAKGMVKISGEKGRCKASLDAEQLRPFMPPNMPRIGNIVVEGYTTADSLAVRVSVDADFTSGAVTPGPVGRDLASGPWNVAAWGFGSFAAIFDASFVQVIRDLPQEDGPEGLQKAMFGLWLLGHLNEMGMGVAAREDGVHAVFRVGTQWANPESVLREYQKITAAVLDGDKDGQAKLAALAEKSPDTPLGRSVRAGSGGGPMIAASVTGILAAVAIPAFVKYKRKAEGIDGAGEPDLDELLGAEGMDEGGIDEAEGMDDMDAPKTPDAP